MKHNIDDLARYLVEGSIWQSRQGKTYTVLFVCNLAVGQKLRERFVPTVVFLNSESDVFSLDCETFLRMYSFVEVNEAMASNLDRIYLCNEGKLEVEEPDVDSFIDEIEAEQKPEPAPVVQPQPPVQQAQPAKAEPAKAESVEVNLAEQIAKSYLIDFVPGKGVQAIGPQDLVNAFVGYQSYIDSQGGLFHKLYFTPSVNIIAYTLNRTFNPSVYGDEENSYELIHLNTGHSDFDIKWNAFGSVLTELVNGVEYFVVVLADMPEEATEAEPVTEEVTEQPRVEPEIIDNPSEIESALADSSDSDQVADVSEMPQEANAEPVTEHEMAETEQPTEVEATTVTEQSIAEPVEQSTEQPASEQSVVEQTEQPKVIAHLVTDDPFAIAQAQSQQRVKTPEEEAMDRYFSVTDITDSQAEKIADKVME